MATWYFPAISLGKGETFDLISCCRQCKQECRRALRAAVCRSDGQFLIGVSDPVDETEQWHGAMPIGWVQRKRIQMSRGSYKMVQGCSAAMFQI
jgi:hypothetical protein